jgi:hypothetical protein
MREERARKPLGETLPLITLMTRIFTDQKNDLVRTIRRI